MTSPDKLYTLISAIHYIEMCKIEGDIVECGVWRGGSMLAAASTLLQMNATNRHIYLFDTYSGMPRPSEEDIDINGISALDEWNRFHHGAMNPVALATVSEVTEVMRRSKYDMNKVHLIKGLVENTIPNQAPERISLLRLDTDYYESTLHEMNHLFPRLVPGGVLILDDYGWFLGARKAVDEYLTKTGVRLFLCPMNDGRVAIKA